MSRAMIQMICDIMGLIPKEADTLTAPGGSDRNRGPILYSRSV